MNANKRYEIYDESAKRYWRTISECSLYRMFIKSEDNYNEYGGDFIAWKADLKRFGLLRKN